LYTHYLFFNYLQVSIFFANFALASHNLAIKE
jgi:hypothetical protein